MKRFLRKRFYIPALIVSGALLVIYWAGSIGYEKIETNKKLSEQNLKLVKSIMSRPNPVKQLKEKLDKANNEIIEKQREIIRQKKVQTIYKFYRDCGTLYSRKDNGKWIEGCWWVTPEHLYKIIILGERYRFMINNYNWDTLDGENMYLCWCANGFNFRTDDNRLNTNGTHDWGLMDLNDVNLYLFPDKGKGKDKYDMEKSIAVWHTWMSKQREYGCWRIWEAFRPDVKKLYFALREVK